MTPKLGFLRVGRQVDTLPPLTREGSVSHRLFIGTVGDYHFKPFFTPSHYVSLFLFLFCLPVLINFKTSPEQLDKSLPADVVDGGRSNLPMVCLPQLCMYSVCQPPLTIHSVYNYRIHIIQNTIRITSKSYTRIYVCIVESPRIYAQRQHQTPLNNTLYITN